MDLSPAAKCFVPEKNGQECSMVHFVTYNKDYLNCVRERERESMSKVYTGPGAGTAQQV